MNWRFFPLSSKPLRMIWKVQKDQICSYLVGTAHFFPYSFKRSITRLLNDVDLVLTEGPLDEISMQEIANQGRDGKAGLEIINLLDSESRREINRLLAKRCSAQDGNDLAVLFQPEDPDYLEMFTREARPWMAFFSIWTTYLGWPYSVDREAYLAALRMGKRIQTLETLEEQLVVLNSIPLERLIRHLNDVRNWNIYQRDYIRFYLGGNLRELVALTDRFPTRTPTTIGERDRLMFNRMKPLFEAQRTAAFIGFPHIPGVMRLFLEDGYHFSQETR